MELALFQKEGLLFLLRWGHFLAGVCWIGLLWYFNFVQGSFFAETDAETKKNATQKLVPRALWWFRWGAMFTVLTGLTYAIINIMDLGMNNQWTTKILTGGLMGIIMWYNVWFVIWPAQQKAIAAANGETVENLPAHARRGFLASRTNTLLSIPMLFFMGSASHLTINYNEANQTTWFVVAIIILGIIEANALKATKGKTTDPIETVKSVITSGFVLTLIFYILLEAIL
jgi:uncharacterized membrane protein